METYGRTKMQSCVWINGKYLQYGTPTQSSQATTELTQNTVINQQAGTANNLCQNGTTSAGVRLKPSSHFNIQDRASNRETSIRQTAEVQQNVSSQRPAGGNNVYYLKVSDGNQQSSSPSIQSGNTRSQVIYGYQVVTQQDFHLNSAQNSSTQSPSIKMNANTTNALQDMSGNLNQLPVILTNPILAFAPSAISLAPSQTVGYRTLNSANAQGIETAPNQHHRQISSRHGLPPSIPPVQCKVAVSQSHRNGSNSTSHPSGGLSFQVSSMSQKSQYSKHRNSTPKGVDVPTSASNSNSFNSCQYENNQPKLNDPQLNPAANTHQKKLSCQISTRFTGSLKSFSPGTDGRPPVCMSSLYNGKQFENKGRMMESNPTKVSVPSPNVCLSSDASQSVPLHSQQTLSLHSGQSLSKPLQNRISPSGKIVHELPHVMQQSENISPQALDILEILEMLTSVNPNDHSIHSSPGRTGPKAIAIVQPLTQECRQVASKQTSKMAHQEHECITTDVSHKPQEFFFSPNMAQNKNRGNLKELSNPLKDDCCFSPKNSNQLRSNESAIRYSVTSDDDAVVLPPDQARSQHSHKPLCADYIGSEPMVNMHSDQIFAPAAQQPVRAEVPKSQNGDKDKSEMPPDAKASVSVLSTLPTTPWTVIPIINLIKAQKSEKLEEFNGKKIINICWGGKCKTLVNQLRTGWYKDLIAEVVEYIRKHLTEDTVILSQVKEGFENQLEHFHVMADNEVYSELPYTSSWLNTNEQLDDIDKDFGFPWSLKYRPCTHDSDGQQDQVERVKSSCAPIESQMQNESLLQTDLEPIDLDEEKHSISDITSTQTALPQNTDSSDPYYLFKIHVLPLNEAKEIFEQSKMPQSTEMDLQPDKVTNNIVENVDVTIIDSKLEKTEPEPVDSDEGKFSTVEVASIQAGSPNKIENACSNDPYFLLDINVLPPEEAKAIFEQTQSKMLKSTETGFQQAKVTNRPIELQQFCCIAKWKQIILGSNIPSLSPCQCKEEQSNEDCADKTFDEEATNKSKYQSKMVGAKQIQVLSSPELCVKVSQTIDSTHNNEKPYSHSYKDPNNLSPLSINHSQSSKVPQPMPDLKPTESSQSTSSHSREKVLSAESEVGTKITTVLIEDCVQAQLTSPDGDSQTFSLKHQCGDSCSQQLLQGVSEYKTALDDTADGEPLASNFKMVELALFGSAPQKKCILIGGHKSRRSSSQDPFHEGIVPPEVLSVRLRPLKRKSSVAVPKGEYSKLWTNEKCRKGFPPSRIKLKSNMKRQKFTSSLRKEEQSGPVNTEELLGSSEMRIWKGNTKHPLSVKRQRSPSYGLKLGEKKTKKYAVTHTAIHTKNKAENRKQEDTVLSFSVLPKTFSFKDAFNGIKDTPDDVSDKADLVGANDKSLDISDKRARGTWYSNPAKRHTLQCSRGSKTSTVFHEYKKKYTEKTQSPTDE